MNASCLLQDNSDHQTRARHGLTTFSHVGSHLHFLMSDSIYHSVGRLKYHGDIDYIRFSEFNVFLNA